MGQSGVKRDALAISGVNNNEAQGIEPQLASIYSGEATNPQGYSPTTLASMRTGALQTAGGATAGAVGQGGLLAARTGNVGGSAAAIDDAARAGGVTDTNANLGIDNQNAQLQEAQRQSGIAGLNSIYNTGTSTSVNALNTANNAQPSFWSKLLMQGLQSGGQVAAAAEGNPNR